MKYLWEKGDKMLFPPSIQCQQLPLCAQVLNTQCPLPAGSVVQLLCQRKRGHLHLPLGASLGCRTMVWVGAAPGGEEAACPAGRRMCFVPLSVTRSDWCPSAL